MREQEFTQKFGLTGEEELGIGARMEYAEAEGRQEALQIGFDPIGGVISKIREEEELPGGGEGVARKGARSESFALPYSDGVVNRKPRSGLCLTKGRVSAEVPLHGTFPYFLGLERALGDRL